MIMGQLYHEAANMVPEAMLWLLDQVFIILNSRWLF
jgi:hypothetical protein